MKKILLTTTALHQPWNEGDWDMTDGNTYAISKQLNSEEDFDALQEVTAELEQAEARIEELQAKLAKAVEFIEDLTGCEWPYCEDAKRVLAELKGQDDE